MVTKMIQTLIQKETKMNLNLSFTQFSETRLPQAWSGLFWIPEGYPAAIRRGQSGNLAVFAIRWQSGGEKSGNPVVFAIRAIRPFLQSGGFVQRIRRHHWNKNPAALEVSPYCKFYAVLPPPRSSLIGLTQSGQ